jgi:hypothetical protein
MWNGALKLGKTRIAVKLHAAIEDSAVHFHLLHDRDHERVKQHMVNPVSGEPRERDQIQHPARARRRRRCQAHGAQRARARQATLGPVRAERPP